MLKWPIGILSTKQKKREIMIRMSRKHYGCGKRSKVPAWRAPAEGTRSKRRQRVAWGGYHADLEIMRIAIEQAKDMHY